MKTYAHLWQFIAELEREVAESGHGKNQNVRFMWS
jgi:hypothetical protein